MSRTALSLLAAAVLSLAGPLPASAQDSRKVAPHVDDRWLPASCSGCHAGHGVPSSPMLDASQKDVCARCHGTEADLNRSIEAGWVAADARPPLLGVPSSTVARHPVSATAFRDLEDSEVTCTSCHSPHREMVEPKNDGSPSGRKRLSPKSRNLFEHELCEGCHAEPSSPESPTWGVGRLLDGGNRSYHPVHTPSAQASPSVKPGLRGKEINCTDCHGSNDPTGPAGPHFSGVPFLLRFPYIARDGAPDSVDAYDLCYVCHDREVVFDPERSFPLHDRHVRGAMISCATCHDPHGALAFRALIRFGDGSSATPIEPSPSTKRLDFQSEAPGSGTCWLFCHGVDHGPKSYGQAAGPDVDPPGPPVRSPRPLPSKGGIRQK